MKKKPEKPVAKRRQGRPKADAPVIGPAQDRTIRRLWIRHWGFSAIAEEIGVDPTTIAHYIRNVVEPAWEKEQSLSRGADLQRVAALEELAWSRIQDGDTGSLNELRKAVGKSKKRSIILEALIERAETGNDANVWLATIRWAVEFRAKVGNFYASRDDGQGADFRRAGQSEKSLAEQAIERLEAALAVRRAAREAEEGREA